MRFFFLLLCSIQSIIPSIEAKPNTSPSFCLLFARLINYATWILFVLRVLFFFFSCLPRSVSSVNQHRAPSHKATSITEGKQRRAPELLWRRQPSKHVLCLPHSPRSRLLLKHLVHHGGHDMARAKRVYTDSVPSPFHRQVPAELDDSRLGGVVHGRGHALVGNKPGHASNEQNGALLLVVEHLPSGGGGAVEDTVVVDVHDLVQHLGAVLERGLEVVDACGGDQTVHAAVVCCDFAEDGVCFFGVAHVDAVVVQTAAVVLVCVLLCELIVGVWGCEAVETVDCLIVSILFFFFFSVQLVCGRTNP